MTAWTRHQLVLSCQGVFRPITYDVCSVSRAIEAIVPESTLLAVTAQSAFRTSLAREGLSAVFDFDDAIVVRITHAGASAALPHGSQCGRFTLTDSTVDKSSSTYSLTEGVGGASKAFLYSNSSFVGAGLALAARYAC